ncbi:LysE family translocator [Flaviaesturariibacter amylovorans]|uniref:LysE family transporter n=1 Tax=Flaviaesturariibacter amylovorans TaxID=1084520 RepID=A0ABP8HR13_9BACT
MWYALIKGLSLGLLLAISVGPLLFTTIKQSIYNGRRGGFAFVAGVSMSDLLLAILVNFFTELFNSIINGQDIVVVIGGLFLVAVGIYFLFFKRIRVVEEGATPERFRKRDFFKVFMTGFLMNVLNPGIWIFWLAAATSLIKHSIDQRLGIFAIALLFVLGTDVLKVLGADKIRKRLTAHNIQFISRLNGFILVCFGVGLMTYYLFLQD